MESPARSERLIISVAQFVELYGSDDPSDRARAVHEEASLEVWRELVVSYPELRMDVALNKRLPGEILDFLSRGDDPRIRWVVAQKRRLPVEIFERLARDSDDGVRSAIVHNKKAPREVLEILAHDKWAAIRKVASRRLGDSESQQLGPAEDQ